MKRSILIILILCFLVPYSESQVWKRKRYQVTVGLGASQLMGDIGGYSIGKNLAGLKDLRLSQFRYDLNVNLKYRITRNFNTRLSLTYAAFHSSDAVGSNEARGLESSTSILEPALLWEYYFIKKKSERPYLFIKARNGFFGGICKALDVYAFTGVGGALYSTKGNDALLNRGLAPQGITPVVPVGLGLSMMYSPIMNFGIELGGRYSFSDNLDGYHSQYSSTNDVYYFLNFTITYKLKTAANGLPSFR